MKNSGISNAKYDEFILILEPTNAQEQNCLIQLIIQS
jgi:hypothetical protein